MITGMSGNRRRTVVEWFRVQAKFKIMFNCHSDLFQIRDMVNDLAVGGFTTWDDAAEWCYNFVHDRLHVAAVVEAELNDPAGAMDVMDDAGGYTNE
jgi:hypothetical protein